MTCGVPPPAATASVDRARLRRAQEDDDVRHLARVQQVANGIALRHRLLDGLRRRALRGGARGHQRRGALGACEAGMHDGHVDARRPQFVGEVLGQRGHRDVADAAHRVAGLARGQPADVDDAPPAARAHAARDLARAAQVAHHLGVQLGVEEGRRDLVELRRRREARRLGRGVDEDVDAAAEQPRRLVHRAAHRAVARGVAGHRDHEPAGLAAQLVRRGAQRLLAAREQRHVGALLRERAGDGLADAAAAAGHEGALAGEFEVHGVSRDGAVKARRAL
jgi:hypothetical protein